MRNYDSEHIIYTKNSLKIFCSFIVLFIGFGCRKSVQYLVLTPEYFRNYIENFNINDQELYVQHIPNDSAFNFLAGNIPIIEIPEKKIEETYYFRWWTFRKHLKLTEVGFVFTEFLPDVSWAGKYNTINCAAAHHIYEGRWLKNPVFVEDYLNFWLKIAGEEKRKYSFWMANAAVAFRSVHPNDSLVTCHLQYFIDNYIEWERLRKDPSKSLFWQFDALDGMEFSASGRILNNGQSKKSMAAVRPTINSYMYGDAKAISIMASIAKNFNVKKLFLSKADSLKINFQKLLWNKDLNFFTVLPRNYSDTSSPVMVRELIGYSPWYFSLPDDAPHYSKAWDYITDSTGFFAPYGLTTCEQSHPYFQVSYTGWECQWNGPVWPYATTITLKALANLLDNYSNVGNMTKDIYFKLLEQYASSHFLIKASGDSVKWIDESQNPFSGDWITRTRLKNWESGPWPPKLGGLERGKDYNHSGFCDLVISDLLGVKPGVDSKIEINPLVPDNWEYFCIDNLYCKEHKLTIIWDKTGKKYNYGKGFLIFVDNKIKSKSDSIEKVKISL